MTDVYQFLADNHVEYERHDHPPVYTVADVERLVPPLPAAKTKNLFLQVDIKTLGAVIGAGRLSFGSADRLKQYLGVDPGSVTILAIIRDPDHAVEVIFDEILWQEEAFQFHPLINTSTLVISRDGLKRFITQTGHEVRLLDVPAQKE